MVFSFIIAVSGFVLLDFQLSPADILEKIRVQYTQMNDASASFTQSVKMRYRQTGQQQSGSVKIKKGNKYRIVTGQQTIVTNGKTVWMYTPENNQVLIDRYKVSRQPFSPDKFLLGLPQEFAASAAEKSGEHIILLLQPSKKNTSLANIISLKIWTVEEKWIVDKVEMTDKNGTVTTISLSGIQFNSGIDDSHFQFDITPAMHVVDLTTLQ